MIEKGRQFLIEEYKSAWQMILNIDERRGKFIHYYSFVFIGVIGVVVNFFKGIDFFGEVNTLYRSRALTASILLFGTVIAGMIVVYMLITERAANIRYRKKVNLIRGLLLEKTDVPKDKYLEAKYSKALGIISLESEGQPKSVGRTLKGVLWFVGAEIIILISGAVILAYYVSHTLMFIEIVLAVAGFTYLLILSLQRLCEAEKISA